MAHPYQAEADRSTKQAMARCKADAAKAVHAHERHDHRGEPLTDLSGMKRGGKIGGGAAKAHLGKFARGGKVRGGPSKVNVIVMAGGKPDQPQAVPVPVPRPVPVPTPPPPGAGGMPPGMPPGGAPPMMPPGGMPPRPPMKRGGAVQFALKDAGSAGGAGRLEKAEAYSGKDMDGGKLVKVKGHTRRAAGGRV